jgi:hypothetical protein
MRVSRSAPVAMSAPALLKPAAVTANHHAPASGAREAASRNGEPTSRSGVGGGPDPGDAADAAEDDPDWPPATGCQRRPRFPPIRRHMTTDADKEPTFASAIGAGGGVYQQAMARVEPCRLKIDPVRVRTLSGALSTQARRV